MEQALDPDPQLAATTDRQLLFDIGKGDERSFDILYRRYARPVAWTARSLVMNGQEEEAVQTTFIALWRKASTIHKLPGR